MYLQLVFICFHWRLHIRWHIHCFRLLLFNCFISLQWLHDNIYHISMISVPLSAWTSTESSTQLHSTLTIKLNTSTLFSAYTSFNSSIFTAISDPFTNFTIFRMLLHLLSVFQLFQMLQLQFFRCERFPQKMDPFLVSNYFWAVNK